MAWIRRNRRYGRRRGFRRRFRPHRRYRVRRSYRRTPRRVTTRRVRNIAARKCRDNMRTATLNGDGTFNAYGGLNMQGQNLYGVLFSPTARVPASAISPNSAERVKSRCFVKGFSERINFRTDTGETWRWRRIVFSTTSLAPYLSQNYLTHYYDGTNGHARSMINIRSGAWSTDLDRVYSVIFEGTRAADWANPLTAKVDRNKVKIYADQIFAIQSNNSRGTDKNFKFWYPINKTIVYDEDEEGANNKQYSRWSDGKMGAGKVGDVFIFDILSSNENTTGDTAIFSPHCTYYWHEGSAA